MYNRLYLISSFSSLGSEIPPPFFRIYLNRHMGLGRRLLYNRLRRLDYSLPPPNPPTPGPRLPKVANLNPVTTGNRREYLLNIFGERTSPPPDA